MDKQFNEKEMAVIYDALFVYRGCVDLDDFEQQAKRELYNGVIEKIKQNYDFDEIKRLHINL